MGLTSYLLYLGIEVMFACDDREKMETISTMLGTHTYTQASELVTGEGNCNFFLVKSAESINDVGTIRFEGNRARILEVVHTPGKIQYTSILVN